MADADTAAPPDESPLPPHHEHRWAHVTIHPHRPHLHRGVLAVSLLCAIGALIALIVVLRSTPVAQTTPSGAIALGQPVVTEQIEITVTDVTTADAGGHHLLRVAVTGRNDGGTARFLQAQDFTVTDAAGKTYGTSADPAVVSLPAGALASGDEVHGTLSFAVPGNSGYQLHFAPNTVSDRYAVSVDLGHQP